jgi:hypothetical protein
MTFCFGRPGDASRRADAGAHAQDSRPRSRRQQPQCIQPISVGKILGPWDLQRGFTA